MALPRFSPLGLVLSVSSPLSRRAIPRLGSPPPLMSPGLSSPADSKVVSSPRTSILLHQDARRLQRLKKFKPGRRATAEKVQVPVEDLDLDLSVYDEGERRGERQQQQQQEQRVSIQQ